MMPRKYCAIPAKCLILAAFSILMILQNSTRLHAYTVPDTGQNKCYDNRQEIPCPQNGEPYYGQDAQYDGPQPTFQYQGNGAVKDLNTGLIWQQGDEQNNPGRGWQKALDYCAVLDLAGHQDWRLPTIKELRTLPDFGRQNPAINTSYFPSCRSDGYWSSKTSNRSYDAWYVDFSKGAAEVDNKDRYKYVRCVRVGP